MSSKPGPIDRAVARVMALDSPAYGDERERAVFMEAVTFGFTVGTYVTLAVALVGAVLGQLLLPAVLVLLAGVPALAAGWYAKRRGVVVDELVDRVEGPSKAVTMAVTVGSMLLTVAAMGYTVLSGHGLLALPDVDVVGPDADGPAASMVRGGVVGALGGLLVAVVAAVVGSWRRARRPEPAEPADEDW